MCTQVNRTIDELGRVILPSVLLQEQGWAPGNKVVFSTIGETVTLELWNLLDETPDDPSAAEAHPKETLTIDNLGRITIPQQLRKTLNWGTRDKIAIRTANNTIILELHERCAA